MQNEHNHTQVENAIVEQPDAEPCGCHHEKIDVGIHIGKNEYFVRQGEYTVEHLKKLADKPLSFELEQLVCGKLHPLQDDWILEIKGGERFVAHPKDGKSS